MIKVGICEDDKICRDTVGKLLEWYFAKRETKYLQKEYKSGKEFMEEKENIDILILDIEMEGISGIQLKDWLWREEKDVKILFVTRHEAINQIEISIRRLEYECFDHRKRRT